MRLLTRLCKSFLVLALSSAPSYALDLQYSGLPQLEESIVQHKISHETAELLKPFIGVTQSQSFLLIPVLEAAVDQPELNLEVLQERLSAGKKIRSLALELVSESVLRTYLTTIDHIAWLEAEAAWQADPLIVAQLNRTLKRWETIRDDQQELLKKRASLLTPERKRSLFQDIVDILETQGLKPLVEIDDPTFENAWFQSWEALRSQNLARLNYRLTLERPARAQALFEYQAAHPEWSIVKPDI
ncbi:MAG: hypothetical protein M3Q07_00040, partial [Pseudobdellovibrionaceae bacterium]|nr:hypothetical protein [Pseudobdellovibrionaceae bacterium]